MDRQRHHHRQGKFGQMMGGGLSKSRRRAPGKVKDVLADQGKKEVTGTHCEQEFHDATIAKHSGAMPQTATPSKVPAPRLMKAQSCLCVRASSA